MTHRFLPMVLVLAACSNETAAAPAAAGAFGRVEAERLAPQAEPEAVTKEAPPPKPAPTTPLKSNIEKLYHDAANGVIQKMN